MKRLGLILITLVTQVFTHETTEVWEEIFQKCTNGINLPSYMDSHNFMCLQRCLFVNIGLMTNTGDISDTFRNPIYDMKKNCTLENAHPGWKAAFDICTPAQLKQQEKSGIVDEFSKQKYCVERCILYEIGIFDLSSGVNNVSELNPNNYTIPYGQCS